MGESDQTPTATVSLRPALWPFGARRRTTRRRVLRGRSGMLVGTVLVALFLAAAVAASWFHHGAYVAQPAEAFHPPAWQSGGSMSHLLGTDALGRDVLSRLLYGIRVSMIIGVASVVVATIAGMLIGIVAGYLGGWVDVVLMRVTDGLLSIPVILLAISIIGAVGASAVTLVFVLAGSQWMSFARVSRSETLTIRHRQFVTAEIALGARRGRIALRHIVPHVLPNMIVLGTLSLPSVILLAAGLDFLGLGSQPPTPSIGGMISDGLQYVTNAAWLSIYPGVALMILVVGINLLGDGLRDITEH